MGYSTPRSRWLASREERKVRSYKARSGERKEFYFFQDGRYLNVCKPVVLKRQCAPASRVGSIAIQRAGPHPKGPEPLGLGGAQELAFPILK